MVTYMGLHGIDPVYPVESADHDEVDWNERQLHDQQTSAASRCTVPDEVETNRKVQADQYDQVEKQVEAGLMQASTYSEDETKEKVTCKHERVNLEQVF